MLRAIRPVSGWLAVLAFCGVVGNIHPPYRIDDSFISFRYAQNLVAGHGLVFNPGERVEGYTNFLWVLALALANRLGADIEIASMVLGWVSGLAAVLLTARLCAALPGGRRLAPIAALLLACCSPFAFWAFSGMETSAFTALLVLAVLLVVRAHQGNGSGAAAGLALAALCLTRPDGAIAAALSIAFLFFDSASSRRRALVAAAVLVALLAPYAGWKLWYYGGLVPNTFYAKVGDTTAQIGRGVRYAGGFLLFTAAAGLLPAAFLGARIEERPRAYVALLVAVQAVYVVLVGGDSFPFFRFLVPVLPFLCLLAVFGFERVRAALAPEEASAVRSRRWMHAAVALACLGAGAYAQQDHYREDLREKASINGRYRAVGLWLKEHSDPADTVAVIAAGIIPYFSERPTIDMLGLTDVRIARRAVPSMGAGMAGHEKGDGRYVLSRRPRFILLHPVTTRAPVGEREIASKSRSFLASAELWDDPEFHRLYQLQSVKLGDFHFNYFERREGE